MNYIRNSVKATVDAYDGSVSLYAWDAEDPLLKALGRYLPRDAEERVRYDVVCSATCGTRPICTL